jgi:transaldolase
VNQTNLHKAAELGQSIWLDYIHRSLITSGELEQWVKMGLRGMTSNPDIFKKAITESDIYDEQIEQLVRQGRSPQEIYEELAMEDIRMAADVLRPVFNDSKAADGYVSLEVNPHLAYDIQGTKNEAKRLFKALDRPNVMIKVPATAEGILAYKDLIKEGININVTLIFSARQYDIVAEAYIIALQERHGQVLPLDHIASVASLFVSRIDTKVDKLLDELKTPEAKSLKGKIGLANAKVAYQRFKTLFKGMRWDYLMGKGAHYQRILFGSTGTKNPDYSDVMYLDNLIGANTVNTVPPKTLGSFLDHGKVENTLENNLEEAQAQLEKLSQFGISLEDITSQLLEEGVNKFTESYDGLIEAITQKQAQFTIA